MESKTPENLNPNPIYKQNPHPKLSHKKKKNPRVHFSVIQNCDQIL